VLGYATTRYGPNTDVQSTDANSARWTRRVQIRRRALQKPYRLSLEDSLHGGYPRVVQGCVLCLPLRDTNMATGSTAHFLRIAPHTIVTLTANEFIMNLYRTLRDGQTLPL
jgi:hypothetical protein